MKTKYYRSYWDSEKGEMTFKEANLKDDNWWYLQLDASIRFAFHKYDMPYPEFVFLTNYHVSDGENNIKRVVIRIIRPQIKSLKKAKKWLENYLFVADELKHQAEANSDFDIEYKFEII